MDLNQRIDELETQLAFQEDYIQQLNQALIDQQNRMDGLEQTLQRLKAELNSRLQQLETPEQEQEIPPHY